MLKFADLLEKSTNELAPLDTMSMGIPLAASAGMIIPNAAAVFRCEY
jgi:acyl-CoA reductase-like NAD-dependent aldehyde dehydrogenase